jgi:hypothetical protein
MLKTASDLDFGATSTVAIKQTAFSESHDAFRQIAELRQRIEIIVERLAGYGVETKAKGEKDPETTEDGILDGLIRGARHAISTIEAAHATLDRLDRII